LQFDDRPFVSVISSGWPVNTQQQQVWDLLEENDFTVVHVSRFQRQGLGFPDKGRFLVTAVLPKHGLDVLDVCNPGQQQRPMYSIRFEPLEAPRAQSATGPWASQQQQQQWWEQQHMEQQAMLQRLFMWQPQQQQQQRGTAPPPPVQPAGAGVGFAPIPAGQLVAPQQQPPLVVQLHQHQQQQPQPPLQQQQQQQQQQQVVSPGWPALPAPLPPWQPPPGFVPPMQPTAHAAVVVPSAAAVAISSIPATSPSPMDMEDASSDVPAQQQQQQLAAEPDAMDVQQSLLESAPVGTMGQQQQPTGSTMGPTHGSAPGQLQQQQLQQPPPQQVPDLSEAPTTAAAAAAAAAAPTPTAAAAAVAVGPMAANHHQQQQQLQPTSNPIPRLPAVAYAVLAVLPALASAFYTPSQLQQQAGSSLGSGEDAFYLWPLLRAPGASIWGHHLRQLVGVARGVEEDWDPGDVNADGQQPLPLADAEALGPAFFAAFQHLVYAGPPEDRLGSVPGEVVAWVRAWLQQRGYRLYRGYE
jgi:hypothetical protein